MILQRSLISLLALLVVSTTHWSTTLASTADPTYTPIIADDMESETLGQHYKGPFGWYTNGTAIISDEQSHSGTKSHKISFTHDYNYYGGANNLPSDYGPGNTIWYRANFYFPSTFSFSNAGGHDAWGYGKFMLLDQRYHAAPRAYLQVTSPIQLDYGDAGFAESKLKISNDAGLGGCSLSSSYILPRDQWVALQFAWKISSTGDGWYRAWADETYLGGCTAPNVPTGYKVSNYGIGNYWNGKAWVQNESTASFWMDDIVVTVDTPNTTDSGGRPYIHPSHFTGGFLAPPMPPTVGID